MLRMLHMLQRSAGSCAAELMLCAAPECWSHPQQRGRHSPSDALAPRHAVDYTRVWCEGGVRLRGAARLAPMQTTRPARPSAPPAPPARQLERATSAAQDCDGSGWLIKLRGLRPSHGRARTHTPPHHDLICSKLRTTLTRERRQHRVNVHEGVWEVSVGGVARGRGWLYVQAGSRGRTSACGRRCPLCSRPPCVSPAPRHSQRRSHTRLRRARSTDRQRGPEGRCNHRSLAQLLRWDSPLMAAGGEP